MNEPELHGRDLLGAAVKIERGGALSKRFLLPPFTILSAREGWWQSRKAAWLKLGIQSEIGRGADAETASDREHTASLKGGLTYGLTNSPYAAAKGKKAKDKRIPIMAGGNGRDIGDAGPADSGTSIFDPVLCELAYRWFAPSGGTVLDPFAGGSVRGIVAGVLGLDYVGIDLSAPQIAANREQGMRILDKPSRVAWFGDDSAEFLPCLEQEVDLIFTCPPYADLERYSDDPRDLSTMDYGDFMGAFAGIIRSSVDKLRDDRFAVVVVGDVRGKDGTYYNLPGDTIRAFRRAGMELYNQAILVTAVGSLSVRCERQFLLSRKMGMTHQSVFVFVKGDPKRATDAVTGMTYADRQQSLRDAAAKRAGAVAWDGEHPEAV